MGQRKQPKSVSWVTIVVVCVIGWFIFVQPQLSGARGGDGNNVGTRGSTTAGRASGVEYRTSGRAPSRSGSELTAGPYVIFQQRGNHVDGDCDQRWRARYTGDDPPQSFHVQLRMYHTSGSHIHDPQFTCSGRTCDYERVTTGLRCQLEWSAEITERR